MMKMCRRSLFLLILTAAAIGFTACGNTPAPNANAAKPNTNAANVAVTSPDSPVATNKKVEVATSNNAPTIGPVVQAYYDALKKKNDTALQNLLSAAYLKKVQADMKAERKTGMAAYLAETDLTDPPIEVRNERIEGDKALAEIKGGAYVNWTPFIFANEGGKWKFTGASPDIQSVTSGPGAAKTK